MAPAATGGGPQAEEVLTEAALENRALDGSTSSSGGSPPRTPYIESFNGKFRDECLNATLATRKPTRGHGGGTTIRWAPTVPSEPYASRIRAADHSMHTGGTSWCVDLRIGAGQRSPMFCFGFC